MMRRIFLSLLGLAIAGYAATGLTTVSPGESAVVFRLGKAGNRPLSRGLHWLIPIGIDRVVKVRLDEVRRIEIGSVEVAPAGEDPSTGEYLTGDRNLIRAKAVIQYRVADPVAFAVVGDRAVPILTRMAESSMTRSLSRRPIDAAIRERRAEVARDVAADLTLSVRRSGLGLHILGVSLIDARPPAEVQADFAIAQAAGSDRLRRLAEAKSKAETTLSIARGEARARVDRAQASADRTVKLARSSADRFEAILAEADRSRGLTLKRIYLDRLEEILPKIRRKIVLAPEEQVDVSLFGEGR